MILFSPVVDTSKEGYGIELIGTSWQDISPIIHVKPFIPATLLFHGQQDSTVPFHNIENFQKQMLLHGNLIHLHIDNFGGHGYMKSNHISMNETLHIMETFLNKLGYLNETWNESEYTKYIITANQFERELLLNNSINSNNNKIIPKYIFRTFDLELPYLPKEFHFIMRNTKLLNTNYIQIYYNFNDRKLFIEKYYPEYYPYYLQIVPGAYQADIFRILILLQFGGIYCDISIQFLKSIDMYIINDQYDEFIAVKEINDWGIQQTFVASYKNHPILLKTSNIIYNNIKNHLYNDNALDITGPAALLRGFNQNFQIKPDDSSIKGGNYTLYSKYNNETSAYHIKLLYHLIGQNETYHNKEDGENYNYISILPHNYESPELKKKFHGYHTLLYGMHKEHYRVLWNKKRVFAS